jgi:hypothetical protein
METTIDNWKLINAPIPEERSYNDVASGINKRKGSPVLWMFSQDVLPQNSSSQRQVQIPRFILFYLRRCAQVSHFLSFLEIGVNTNGIHKAVSHMRMGSLLELDRFRVCSSIGLLGFGIPVRPSSYQHRQTYHYCYRWKKP